MPRSRATSPSWWRSPTRSARCGRRWPRSDREAGENGGPRHGPPYPPALGTAPGFPGRSSSSLAADLEVGVVASRRRLRLVGVPEDRDADGLRRVPRVEELLPGLEHGDPFL